MALKTFALLNDLQFNDLHAHAEPLLIEDNGRVLRFALKPGQSLKAQRSGKSSVHVFILQGCGLFGSEGGQEQLLKPHTLVLFKEDELHSIRALDEELVFLAYLRKVQLPAEEGAYLTWHMG